MYLSGSTCIMLIIKGAGVMELLVKLLCEGGATCDAESLTGAEWFLVFTCMAIALAQRPNLNSIAGDRPSGVSHDSLKVESSMAGMLDILNANGIIVLAFRGHNLVLEIQGTLPTSLTNPSKRTMWRGVSVSYMIIAMCQFPLAIAGFWAYGNKIPSNGGMLTAFFQFHGHDTSKSVKGLVYLLVAIHCLSSFQIYAMPVFDNLEFRYVSMKNRRCPWWVRFGFRLFFGGLAFFIAVALPFLPRLAPLIGGITLPLTLAYPCFMWILIKKPHQKGHAAEWCLNLGVGCLGIFLSVLLVVAAAWDLAIKGLHATFFKPPL
ncbi:LYSINE HISTIDINE TRANSPORTER-LIKE 7 [Salix viminalis]|uniref:LYSINE HISTIDINE TRANSPORTER-LIKE 7 n=1 Tax=Salix viminalis TaxID=40686 RepID=A0A9Q0QK06_SALVM|nr:LYSINE HISTIDINE TRANSPORTER-LIKE 7 [Salix viminalis]